MLNSAPTNLRGLFQIKEPFQNLPSRKNVLESAEWTDFAFVLITGLIAYHGISYRDADGERELVHLLFGCIALFYGIWVLGRDILGVL